MQCDSYFLLSLPNNTLLFKTGVQELNNIYRCIQCVTEVVLRRNRSEKSESDFERSRCFSQEKYPEMYGSNLVLNGKVFICGLINGNNAIFEFVIYDFLFEIFQ